MKKQLLAWALTLALMISILPLGAAALGFTDVPTDAYYYEPVQWAVESGVTKGTSDTTFSPDATCTRAQVVTFLWRAAGTPEPSSTRDPFSDVAADAYYFKAVLWAVEREITLGTSATTFSPDQGCTRGQVVTFLWRTAGQPGAASGNPFSDVAQGDYFRSAVLWAVENGVTKGTGANTFSPNDTCTRAQIVTFLFRAKDLLGGADTHAVTFRLGDPSDSVYQLSVVKHGEKLAKPEQPRRAGFAFTGWFSDAACTASYAFDKPVNADLTLYAGWRALSDDMQSYAAASAQDVCAITDLSVGDGKAAAVVSTDRTARLTITVTDEDTGRAIASVTAQTPERGQQLRIELPLDEALPEHFMLRATLQDETGRDLCEPYQCIRYTEAYAAFEEKTTEDFPEALVVDFDGDKETNFGVLNENVRRIGSAAGENILTAKCDDGKTVYYEIQSPSAAVRGLKPGDDVYLAGSNGETALLRVGGVETLPDGSLRLTQGTADSVTDFYSYIDVDAWFGKASGANAGAMPMAEIVDVNKDKELKFIHKDFDNKDDKELKDENLSLSGHLYVTGVFHLVMRYDLHLLEKDEYEFQLSTEIIIDAAADMTDSMDFGKEIKLVTATFPLGSTGLTLTLEPYITLGVTGEAGAHFSYYKSEEYGFKCTSSSGFEKIARHDDPVVKADAEASFELVVGPKLVLSLGALGGTVNGSLTGTVNLAITGEAHAEYDSEADLPDEVHMCLLCIDGDVTWLVNVRAGITIKVGDKTWTPVKEQLLFDPSGPVKFMGDPDGHYYLSVINTSDSVHGGKPKLGGGTCPNRKYRVDVTVQDANGKTISGNSVTITDASGAATSYSAPFHAYLYSGSYTFNIAADGYQSLSEYVSIAEHDMLEYQMESEDAFILERYRAAMEFSLGLYFRPWKSTALVDVSDSFSDPSVLDISGSPVLFCHAKTANTKEEFLSQYQSVYAPKATNDYLL